MENLYELLHEDVDHWLLQWARYMRHNNTNRLGYPHKSLCFIGGGESQRWADWEEDEETKSWRNKVVLMNVLINDLPPAQRLAVNHVYLGTTVKFPRDNLIDLIQMAAHSLLIGMEGKGIV